MHSPSSAKHDDSESLDPIATGNGNTLVEPDQPINEPHRVRVSPTRFPLLGSEVAWEAELVKRGWNHLAEKDRYGYVVAASQSTCLGAKTLEVEFPALGITLQGIFPDQLRRVWGH